LFNVTTVIDNIKYDVLTGHFSNLRHIKLPVVQLCIVAVTDNVIV
jgi:hypothetical protein